MSDFPIQPRPCAVCGSDGKRHLYSQRFSGLSDACLLEGYEVAVCARCGLAYADGLPPQEAFDAYYRDLSKYENQHIDGVLSPYDKVRFPETAGLLADSLRGGKLRVLEIGCSTGGLLEALKAAGFEDLVGLDPSPVCTRMARERCGVETITGSLSDLGPEAGAFDLIILGSVLEHLRDMDAAMATLKARLAPGGHLYLEVPDASRFAEEVQAPFQEFSLEHITYFSPRTLENLLGVHGFAQVFTKQATPRPSAGIVAFEIKALFKWTGEPRALVPDEGMAAAMEAYITRSRALENKLGNIIDGLAESRRPVLVWGVGTHTQHLLVSSRLAYANIRAFVDSNPNYQGRSLHGAPVLGPGELAGRPEAILISSQQFQEEIADQIRKGLGLPNEILRLY